MFFHNFRYSLKILTRNRTLLFWTFIFPILLGTFFYLAFSDIEKNETLDVINIAIIPNDSYKNNKIYNEAFKKLSDKKNKDRLFNIKYIDETSAKKLLNKKRITGYLNFEDEDIKITVLTSGINETILRYVIDEVKSEETIINTLVKNEAMNDIKKGNYNIDYNKIYMNANKLLNSDDIKIKDISNNNLSYTMIEYYTLIAMAALYGSIISMFITNYYLANMNSIGKRVSISKISKFKLLFSGLLSSYIIQVFGLLLLFLYTIFVLKVDYGTNFNLVMLLSLVSVLAGLSLGVAVSVLIKKNDNAKTGILIGITMLGCFLSGMMGITMKYIVDKNIPILNLINPASMITDGFYALYYYNTLDKYYFDIISLVLFSAIMLVISIKSLRRQKYDSI